MYNKNRMYKVYHIRPVGQTDTSKFYIGITKNRLELRLSKHMTSKRPVGFILRDLGREAVEIVELHRGSHDEALQLEYKYRPNRNMGWNVQAGDNKSTVVCGGCGKHLPKRKTGSMCGSCNDRKFTKGAVPHNKGNGVKASLRSPEGLILKYESITDFCKEHNLVPANVRKVIKGERKHTKGWTLVSIEG